MLRPKWLRMADLLAQSCCAGRLPGPPRPKPESARCKTPLNDCKERWTTGGRQNNDASEKHGEGERSDMACSNEWSMAAGKHAPHPVLCTCITTISLVFVILWPRDFPDGDNTNRPRGMIPFGFVRKSFCENIGGHFRRRSVFTVNSGVRHLSR